MNHFIDIYKHENVPRDPQYQNNQAINAMISCIAHEVQIEYRLLCAKCTGLGGFRRFSVRTSGSFGERDADDLEKIVKNHLPGERQETFSSL